jgi:gas vesicle protein
MSDHEEYPYVVVERRGGSAGAFLWGALLGAGVALLLAPRSGAETQDEIKATARRVRDAATGQARDAREKVTAAVGRTRDLVDEKISHAREAVEVKTEQARQAIRAGREAALTAREELERRVDDAKVAYRAGVSAARTAGGRAADGGPRLGRSAPATVVTVVPDADVTVTEIATEDAAGSAL